MITINKSNHVFVSNSHQDWKSVLPQIDLKVKDKTLRVIITSRHNIIEEAKNDMDKITMFKGKADHIVRLESSALSPNEMKDILQNIIERQDMEDEIQNLDIDLSECVRKARGVPNVFYGKKEGFVFGFPECASLFATETLIQHKSDFFKKPEHHFKAYIEQMYNAKDKVQFIKFLALVAVWAEKNRKVKEEDLQNPQKVSEHIQHIAEVFGRTIDDEFIEVMKSSLQTYAKYLLLYIDHSGEYTFSHNVIGEMVGVVLGKKKTLECIQLCPRGFLMERVAISSADNDVEEDEELRVHVKTHMHKDLCTKFVDMILRKNCNAIETETPRFEFDSFKRRGVRGNTIEMKPDIDFALLKHRAFKDTVFVKTFIQYLKERNLQEELFSMPVITMTGYFFDYGIKMDQTFTIYLPGYTLYNELNVLAKQLIERNVFQGDQVDALLLATHTGNKEMMRLLLSHGAKVAGDTIYVAMHKMYTKNVPENPEVLEVLLQKGVDVNDKGNIVHGNYPLIVAARKNFTLALSYLLKHGADPSAVNDSRMTALHKAVIYQHYDIIRHLLNANAPVNVKGGKFKRTPLHIASDKGDERALKMLLEKGADVKVKDYRGHYPVFLAAFRGHLGTVKILLQHDKQQEQLRIASYGPKSVIKGMYLYHVAVWKNNLDLLKVLFEVRANPNVKDFFGRTPFYFAIKNNRKSCIKLLLGNDANINIPEKQGYTPLHAAVYEGNAKLVAQLAPKVDINKTDKYGYTPLLLACEKGHVNVVNLLLKNPAAKIDTVTKRGDTVLHILRRRKGNTNNEDRYKRLLMEQLLLEHDPKLFETFKTTKNKKGVPVVKATELTKKERKVIATLKKQIISDFGDLSDDDELHPLRNTEGLNWYEDVVAEEDKESDSEDVETDEDMETDEMHDDKGDVPTPDTQTKNDEILIYVREPQDFKNVVNVENVNLDTTDTENKTGESQTKHNDNVEDVENMDVDETQDQASVEQCSNSPQSVSAEKML